MARVRVGEGKGGEDIGAERKQRVPKEREIGDERVPYKCHKKTSIEKRKWVPRGRVPIVLIQ